MKFKHYLLYSFSLISFVFFLSAFNSHNTVTGNNMNKHVTDTLPKKDTTILTTVEIEASFPGGESAWRMYLQKNLNPDVPVKKGAPVGRYTTIIQFVVDKDGSVSDIEGLTNYGYGMEDEVIRILKKSPHWVPAIQFGKSVRAYRKQPVTFAITEEPKKKRRS